MSYCVEYPEAKGMRAWIESCYPDLDGAKERAQHKALVTNTTIAVRHFPGNIVDIQYVGWFDRRGRWIPSQSE